MAIAERAQAGQADDFERWGDLKCRSRRGTGVRGKCPPE